MLQWIVILIIKPKLNFVDLWNVDVTVSITTTAVPTTIVPTTTEMPTTAGCNVYYRIATYTTSKKLCKVIFLALGSLYVPRIIKVCECTHLLQAKM